MSCKIKVIWSTKVHNTNNIDCILFSNIDLTGLPDIQIYIKYWVDRHRQIFKYWLTNHLTGLARLPTTHPTRLTQVFPRWGEQPLSPRSLSLINSSPATFQWALLDPPLAPDKYQSSLWERLLSESHLQKSLRETPPWDSPLNISLFKKVFFFKVVFKTANAYFNLKPVSMKYFILISLKITLCPLTSSYNSAYSERIIQSLTNNMV